jgi:hypothetical protein
MTGFRSLASSVMDALGAAIVATAPTGANVSVGYPAGGLADQQIWVGGDFDDAIAWATTGWHQRSEEGTCKVRCSVLMTTVVFKDVRDACVALTNAVEDALAVDRTLGGLVDRCEVSGSKGLEAVPDEHQRSYGVELTVSWTGEATA